MRRHIVLFSPFSPDLGGGGTNLRTLVPELRRTMDIEWLYTADSDAREPNTLRLDRPISGGPVWRDLTRTLALWSNAPLPRFRRLVASILARKADGYWIIGTTEGTAVARALTRAGARVHLTVQDDVPEGVLRRSRRYRALASFVAPRYDSYLRQAASVDVTSDGMERYYRERLGLRSIVVHPLVAALPPVVASPPSSQEIRIGHIGSLYATTAWVQLLQALRSTARARNAKPKMVMIGLAKRFQGASSGFEEIVEFVPELPEDAAVQRLQECHAVYAMYPFERESDVFRRTSLPTKLTTYVKTQRPILAHSPADSTLLDVVERFQLGVACTTDDHSALASALERTLSSPFPTEAFERARTGIYDIDNAERLRGCLDAL